MAVVNQHIVTDHPLCQEHILGLETDRERGHVEVIIKIGEADLGEGSRHQGDVGLVLAENKHQEEIIDEEMTALEVGAKAKRGDGQAKVKIITSKRPGTILIREAVQEEDEIILEIY